MNERTVFEIADKKERIFAAHGWQCQYPGCGKRARFLAHRIAQSKANIRKYGAHVIHHSANLVPVCEDPRHNDAMNIGNRPLEAARLCEWIEKHIETEERR